MKTPLYKQLTANAWVSLAVVIGTTLFYLITHHDWHLVEALPYILIIALTVFHFGFQYHKHGSKN
jgi:hypothetical protein